MFHYLSLSPLCSLRQAVCIPRYLITWCLRPNKHPSPLSVYFGPPGCSLAGVLESRNVTHKVCLERKATWDDPARSESSNRCSDIMHTGQSYYLNERTLLPSLLDKFSKSHGVLANTYLVCCQKAGRACERDSLIEYRHGRSPYGNIC
ncbi:hypothetical protein LX36DRAFT_377962 [Colletotrichum falcatum]|nr:hypothetical protein LX36DRAFT_377962 [Colletotrichum falcatum]